MEIEVLSMNFYDYPNVFAKVLIKDEYRLEVQGRIKDFKYLDLNYNISSDCLVSDVCIVEDTVNVNGTLSGPFRDILIRGEGTILDGNVSFHGTKKRKAFENVELTFTDINSSKLFEIFEADAVLHGKANVYAHFETIGKRGKKGFLTYDVKDNNFTESDLAAALKTHVNIHDNNYTFTMDLNTATSKLSIIEGAYDQEL